MAQFVYNALLAFLSPLIYLYLLYRLAIGKEDRRHWRERWGWLPSSVGASPLRIWIHAVSVGEVIAAAPVLRELRERWPRAILLLTTTTPSGRQVALKQVPQADIVAYYPLDFLPVVRRALRIVRPQAVLLMEWEIWPNFLQAARREGAKIAVLNGRISDRGLKRGRRAGFFTRIGLECVDAFAMQSAEDARRAELVGAPPHLVRAVGNTKFDESPTPLTANERAALRADLGLSPDAPVLVCGSTRPGEEAIIADAALRIWKVRPDLKIIVAPRHLDRADDAERAFTSAGIEVIRRSNRASWNQITGGAAAPVMLLDTFGELSRVYAVAHVAFVGGSLLPFGGQSVFQPLAQGVPTLFGPYMNNQRDIAALAKAEGVGFEARDASGLASEALRILALSDSERMDIARRAQGLIERNQGVARQCVALVERLLQRAAASA